MISYMWNLKIPNTKKRIVERRLPGMGSGGNLNLLTVDMSRHPMYSIMNIVNKTVLYTRNLLRQ